MAARYGRDATGMEGEKGEATSKDACGEKQSV